jgi:hypothetical protein
MSAKLIQDMSMMRELMTGMSIIANSAISSGTARCEEIIALRHRVAA